MTFVYDSYWYLKYLYTRHNQAEITGHMWDLIEQSYKNPSLKWHMLSGHDTSVAPMQAALNITNFDCMYEKYKTGTSSSLNCRENPSFTANIIIEFYKD